MVTLYLNDIPVRIPADIFAGEILKALPDLLTAPGDRQMSGKERAMRLGMKPVIRFMLDQIGSEMQRKGAPFPRPVSRLEPGQDWIEYGVGYLLNLVLALVESRPWPLECVDTPDGIVITGLANVAPEAPGLAAPLALPAPTEPEVAELGS